MLNPSRIAVMRIRLTQTVVASGSALMMLMSAASAIHAGANAEFTLPLHALMSAFEPCHGYLPVDCLAVPPTTEIPGDGPTTVFILLANHTAVLGAKAGLEWDPSWNMRFVFFDCQFGQTYLFNPGPSSLWFVTAFNCLSGPALSVMGRVGFDVGPAGCLRYVQPDNDPFGIHVLDCTLEVDSIFDDGSPRLGRVCVGPGGHDACSPVTPVAGATWGAIKASYR